MMQQLKGRLRPLVKWLRGSRPSRLNRYAGKLSDVPTAEREATDLHRAFYGNDGPTVFKWTHYLGVYDHHLSRFQKQQAKILEIGVYKGGSLRLWREYFGPKAVIFGVDINSDCRHFDGDFGHVRIGSQDDPAFLSAVVEEMGGVDIVIDDGSHIARHQRASFDALFPLLSNNGVYICEDTHTSYWRKLYDGGYRRKASFIEYAKVLLDDMHCDFHDRGERALKGACRSIGSISFYNSMVVVEKQLQSRPMHLTLGSAHE